MANSTHTKTRRSDFYKDVIKERFGLEKLEGDLDSECLPRLYKLFSQVPDSHSRQAKLKTVKRKKDKGYFQGHGTVIVFL